MHGAQIVLKFLLLRYRDTLTLQLWMKFISCFCLKSNSSDTDGSESERDRDCSGSGCNDDEDSEVWHEDVDDLFLRCDK